ncbi:MAG: hypothetical protein ACYTGP_05160 [Planctomycetota bacterium]|jgi:hypothetical protein
MTHRTTIMMLALAGLLLPASSGLAGPKKKEHFDVWVRVDGSTLRTGRITEDGIPQEPEWRVFGAEFGEDPQFPFNADEPGFQLEDGTVTPGELFHFVMPDKLTRWTGDGLEATAETMTVSFGPGNTTTGAGFADGFDLAADGLGGFHSHFELTINPGALPEPTDGIYVLPLIWAGKGGSFTGTPTFWFVMNLNMPEEDHDAAMDWVQENLADPPARCPSDTDENGVVDFGDILRIISDWGPCP